MSVHHPKSAWTDERVALLKTLWAAGELSAKGIAAVLGHGITRNAVIGKVGRLGLPKRAHNPYPRNRAPRARRASNNFNASHQSTPKTKKTRPARIEPDDVDAEVRVNLGSLHAIEAEPAPDTFLGIPLLKLQDKHCRYPRIVDGVTLFCGQPKTFTIAPDGTPAASSYCVHCHRRCHTGDFGRRSSNYVFARRAA